MDYLFHVLIMCGIYSILAISLNLLIGHTGLPALGHAAFSCVGAYVSALLALQVGLSPWFGMLAGAVAAVMTGFIIAIPSLRLRGDYLALATFGFAIIVYSLAKNWVTVTRGPLGLPGIPSYAISGWTVSTNGSFLALVIVWTMLTAFLIGRIANAPFGRVLRGIREDEIAAAALGKHVNAFKVKVFLVGAFFAGIAGSLYAHYITFIDPSSFSVVESITILLMVVFGGMGSLRGAVAGATLLVVFPEVLRFVGFPSAVEGPLRQMVYGMLLVCLMIWRPQGIMGRYKLTVSP